MEQFTYLPHRITTDFKDDLDLYTRVKKTNILVHLKTRYFYLIHLCEFIFLWFQTKSQPYWNNEILRMMSRKKIEFRLKDQFKCIIRKCQLEMIVRYATLRFL